jgi:hypothetical protein
MNLPDFHQFEPLNRLKEQMGIHRDQYGAFPQRLKIFRFTAGFGRVWPVFIA